MKRSLKKIVLPILIICLVQVLPGCGRADSKKADYEKNILEFKRTLESRKAKELKVGDTTITSGMFMGQNIVPWNKLIKAWDSHENKYPNHKTALSVVDEKISEINSSGFNCTVNFGIYLKTKKDEKEPIEWIVLDVDEETKTATLISRYIIEYQPMFNSEYSWAAFQGDWSGPDKARIEKYRKNCIYENSSLRKFLNEKFYDSAFRRTEEKRILKNSSTGDNVYILDELSFNLFFGTEIYDNIYINYDDESDKFDGYAFKGNPWAATDFTPMVRLAWPDSGNNYWLASRPPDIKRDYYQFQVKSTTGLITKRHACDKFSGVRPCIKVSLDDYKAPEEAKLDESATNQSTKEANRDESKIKQSMETSSGKDSIEQVYNEDEDPYYEEIEETKETSEFKKLYSRFKNKGLNVAYYKSVVDIICRPDQNWRINKTLTYKENRALVVLKEILSKDFTDKYNEKDGVVKAKGYDFEYLDNIYITPTLTEDKVVVEYAKDHKEHQLIGNLIFDEDNKITDIEFYLDFIYRDYSKNDTFGAPYEIKQTVGLYEETFVDGIVNYCMDYDIVKKTDLDGGPTINLELVKTNFKEPRRKKNGSNVFSDYIDKYNGIWLDKDKKCFSWEDKFVNISIITVEDGNDYKENYIVKFAVNDNKLSGLSFRLSTRELVGKTNEREERKRKKLEEESRYLESLWNEELKKRK